MNILLCGPLISNANHGAECGIYDALQELGHESYAWDYRCNKLVFPNGNIEKQERQKTLPKLDLDVVLCPGAGLPDEILNSKAWKSIDGLKINWNSEPIRLPNYRDKILRNSKQFDLFFTFDESEIPLYKENNIAAHWLPQAFNPKWYKPISIPRSQKFPNALCFIGSIGGKWAHRHLMINRLKTKGFKIHVATIFDAERVNQAYNMHDGVLNLGLYCDGCGPPENLRSFGLQQRIFECIGAGQVCITNEIPSDTNRLFEYGKHILYYNKHNLESICRLVFDKNVRNELRENILKIRDQHTYKARMSSLIDVVNKYAI